MARPNVWLLPQLWTDLLTWALSVYQQTAQAAVDTSSSEDAVTVQMMQASWKSTLEKEIVWGFLSPKISLDNT